MKYLQGLAIKDNQDGTFSGTIHDHELTEEKSTIGMPPATNSSGTFLLSHQLLEYLFGKAKEADDFQLFLKNSVQGLVDLGTIYHGTLLDED